ncbi:transposase family protein [Embleya sp. AB8]|uniref:transposase family protein n=1 Tax=Embleya sp. AB8 TaxID=3156304 RepID=UPI003C72C64F
MQVEARCTTTGASCPVCGTWSNRVHGSYLRFPTDLPSGGRQLVVRLRVRRFVCRDESCARKTFVEQIPMLTRRHGQRTERLQKVLAEVGLVLAGRAGSRLAGVFGVSVSRSTVLRFVDALPEPVVTSGTTSAKPRNEASRTTADAFVSWSRTCPTPVRNRSGPKPIRRARRGPPATGSPTGPGPTTPRCTRCWPPATAAARSRDNCG